MEWNGLKKIIGKAAPLIGSALAGPAGGTVGAMLANALGTEPEADAVAQAIQQDPGALLKIKQFELENEQHLREITFKTLQVELADKANARLEHKDSNMPAIIVWLLTTIAAGLTWGMFNTEIPEANKDVAFMLFGQVVTLWGASITYWVGTTRSSSDKSKMLGINRQQ